MIIEIPNVSDVAEDNRILGIKGAISQPGDYDEAFRDIVKNFGKPIMEVRAFTKAQKTVSMNSLIKLSGLFNLLIVIDHANDFFFIKYHEKGEIPLELPVIEIEESEEETEEEVLSSNEPVKTEEPETNTVNKEYEEVETENKEPFEDDQVEEGSISDGIPEEIKKNDDDDDLPW